MSNENGVKESESLPDEKLESQSELGEDASSKSNGRSIDQVVAENKRKAEEIKELRAKVEAMEESHLTDKEERLAELQEKSRLSSSDRQEMETLEDQISAIKADPRSKPWVRLNQDISTKAAKALLDQREAEQTEDYVTELAEKEGVPFDKFEREMVRFMRRADPGAEMSTLRRAKKAYKLYQDEQSYSKREAALKEKEKQFAETGGAKPSKPQSRSEILQSTKTPEGMRDFLKSVADQQHEATSR